MRKIIIGIAILLLLLVVIAYIVVLPKTPVLTGYASRMICTCHFAQNRSLDQIQTEDLGFSLFNYVTSNINEEDQSVTSSIFGFTHKTSKYIPGNGCVLLKEDQSDIYDITLPNIIDTFQWNVSNRLTATQKALIDDMVFDKEGAEEKVLKSRSCLILHKDSIIYERYTSGFDKDTPQLGWSMTKSVMSTLIGLKIQDQKTSLQEDHLYNYWDKDRSTITVEDLLHMRSGLEWTEDYASVCPATIMLFDSKDMAEYASRLPLESPVGSTFEYSSGTSNILADLVYKYSDNKDDYLRFPYERLFKPLGMKSAFIEVDESGNFVGSSYMYASTRDWTKYGLLYLNRGYFDGLQVLDSSWVDYTFESDPVSNGIYGAQFWHNDDHISLPNTSEDLIFADGFQGQRVFILPNEDLIIVRLGLTNLDFDKLISTVVEMVQ